MRTKVSPALNGIELHALDPAIVVRGVREEAPSWRIDTGSKGDGVGMFMNRVEKQSRSVTITFSIFTRDPLKRAQVIQAVNAWAAAGGVLTTDYRDGQALAVVCTQIPSIENIKEWTAEFQVTFTAYAVPFWQSIDRTQVTIAAATSGTATMTLKETAGGKLCAIGVNGSGATVTGLTISAGGDFIELDPPSGEGIANGENVVIGFDENDIMYIRAESTGTARSILGYRTPESADYIPLTYGANVLAVTSSAAMSWTLFTYGRWE